MADVTLTLIGKPGCHLCEDALTVVTEVMGELTSDSQRYILEEKSIENDPELFDQYWEQIPVLLIEGKVHNYWRIDPDRLTTALKGIS